MRGRRIPDGYFWGKGRLSKKIWGKRFLPLSRQGVHDFGKGGLCTKKCTPPDRFLSILKIVQESRFKKKGLASVNAYNLVGAGKILMGGKKTRALRRAVHRSSTPPLEFIAKLFKKASVK